VCQVLDDALLTKLGAGAGVPQSHSQADLLAINTSLSNEDTTCRPMTGQHTHVCCCAVDTLLHLQGEMDLPADLPSRNNREIGNTPGAVAVEGWGTCQQTPSVTAHPSLACGETPNSDAKPLRDGWDG
jgi:hypothetical protein